MHDDDVHSYDDVIGALAGLGLSVARARDLAGRVDREGDALLPLGDAQTALRAVHARGLLGAAVDDELLERELRATQLAKWLSELVRGADALRRLVGVIPGGAGRVRDELVREALPDRNRAV